MNVQKFIQRLKESESYKKFKEEKEEVDETSVTGMVAGYQTPKAFAPSQKAFDAKTKANAEQLGYEIVPPSKRRQSISKEEFAKQESVRKSKKKSMNESSGGDTCIDSGGENPINGRHAWHVSEDAFYKYNRKISETSGYKVVEPRNTPASDEGESAYKQAMRSLYEASYKEYKGDKTRTTSEKINHSIKELNQSLLQVERAVGHALRLKTEMAVDQRTFWRSSQSRLTKIGERLNRIGKKINELGA